MTRLAAHLPVPMFGLIVVAVLLASPVRGQSTAPQVPTDWDLLMLKLVNAARIDPAAENQLRGTSYSNAPVPPLAYLPALGRAASNHNYWMTANISNPAINDPTNNGPAPDSFTHYETTNAQANGSPATGTAGYSGATNGGRINYVGYDWSSAGENIFWRSYTPTINTSTITTNHVGWWNSGGHRNNFMRSSYTAFGHDALNTSNHFATQTLARPLASVRTYLLGVLYDDRNQSGQWEPHDLDDPRREGLGGVAYRVYSSATGQQIGGNNTTLDNGAFSFLAGNGTYDLQFLLDDEMWVRNVSLSGANIDLGDLAVGAATNPLAGDFNDDGTITLADYAVWRDHLGGSFDLSGNGNDAGGSAGVVDASDYTVWREHFSNSATSAAQGTTVPEPGSAILAVLGLATLRQTRRRR